MENRNKTSSFDKLPPERLREISRKAGRNSGIARRKKREEINRIKLEKRAEKEAIREQIKLIQSFAKVIKSASKEL